jgi:hypothetical protein
MSEINPVCDSYEARVFKGGEVACFRCFHDAGVHPPTNCGCNPHADGDDQAMCKVHQMIADLEEAAEFCGLKPLGGTFQESIKQVIQFLELLA